MKTKNLIIFSFFIILYFLQAGILYMLIIRPDINEIINGFLFSGLIMCFSGSFILLQVGLKSEKLEDNQKILTRSLALILLVISLSCFIFL